MPNSSSSTGNHHMAATTGDAAAGTTSLSPSPAKDPSASPIPSPSPALSPSPSPSGSRSPSSDPNPNPNADDRPPPDSSDPVLALPADDPNPNPNTAESDPTVAQPPPIGPLPPPSRSRRLPPPCWSHEETLALIDSYREKWYALRRGNLRANHWEEVAQGVTRRCHRLITTTSTTPKTSVQCRHKVEKLRKRYRSEKQRALQANPISPPPPSWVYFRKMDAMEHGTTAAPPSRAATTSQAAPLRSGVASPLPSSSEDPSASASDQEEDRGDAHTNKRGLQRQMGNGTGGSGPISGLRFWVPKAMRSKMTGTRLRDRTKPKLKPHSGPSSDAGNKFFKGHPETRSSGMGEMRRRLEKKRRRESENDLVGEMVAAVRMLGDGFIRMEEMKMDTAKEMEKMRMEMELKRTEMILDSQRRIVDSFVKSLSRDKRGKVGPGP